MPKVNAARYTISALLGLFALLFMVSAFIFALKKFEFSMPFPHISTNGILFSIFIVGIIIAIVLLQEILKLKFQLHSVARSLKEQIHDSVESKFIEISVNREIMRADLRTFGLR